MKTALGTRDAERKNAPGEAGASNKQRQIACGYALASGDGVV